MKTNLHLRRVGAAFLLGTTLAAFGFAGSASAAEKELLDILRSNGAITQEQYDDLLKKEELKKEDVSNVGVTLDKRGFRIKSEDGAFAMKLGARLHFQASAHDGDTGTQDSTDGTEVRRARIEMAGRFYDDWRWVAEADFANNEVSIKDFWLGYTGMDIAKFYAGHAKQPYSLSLEMSSNDIPFIERSIANDLVVPFVDRAMGVRTELLGDNWFFAGGLFGEGASGNDGPDEGWGTAARFIYTPVLSEDQVLHLGIRGAYRETRGDEQTVDFQAQTTNMSNLFVIDTGDITDVDDVTLAGFEASYAHGPLWVAGEYHHAFISRDTGGDLDFDAWEVFATWTLTGESHAPSYRMNAGEFKRLTARENFSLDNGTWGAWELGGRIASLDTSDGAVNGGEALSWTTALNWYVNPAVRFMIEWTRFLDVDGATPAFSELEDLNLFQFRTQFTY